MVVMKVEAGVEVRGRTFSLPPAGICQAVIAPRGEFFQSRGRRFLSSHMMLCLFPACRGVGGVTFLSNTEQSCLF